MIRKILIMMRKVRGYFEVDLMRRFETLSLKVVIMEGLQLFL